VGFAIERVFTFDTAYLRSIDRSIVTGGLSRRPKEERPGDS